MDEVFRQEQDHLSEVYAVAKAAESELVARLEGDMESAFADRESMLEALAIDFSGDVDLETYVELEALHQLIDSYNLGFDSMSYELSRVRLLLAQPYFAKVTLQLPNGSDPRDVYIGAAGLADKDGRQIVVDWRSPIAETYYSQGYGPTSYKVDTRTINVELLLRRQFDITRDVLKSYFDTTVAIQDPLLLASLRKSRSSKLGAITATIQQEQNAVIRHEDVDVLLVSGIAGSGKTSVLLQRIAYLLYHSRDTLRPDDVYLITPNPVFSRYIDQVLPDMGERNPQMMTWDQMTARLGLGQRGLGRDDSWEGLRRIDELLPSLVLGPHDVSEISVGEWTVLSRNQIAGVLAKHHSRIPAGRHLAGLVEETLEERIEQRAKQLAHTEAAQDEMLALPPDEQHRLFGRQIVVEEEEELYDLTLTYLNDLFTKARDDVADGKWLRIDRIGMRLLGKESISSTEYLYLKLALTGSYNRTARYVMVDEVQDYTSAQIMVLAAYFANAHFLLLGDENQAIRRQSVSFAEISDIFAYRGKKVCQCRLLTSYRSSPEITELFCKLMDPTDGFEVQSVQEPGSPVAMHACADEDAYAQALREALAAERGEEGLIAFIADRKRHLEHMADLLGEDMPFVISDASALPDSGIVCIPLELAKGLEFDRAVIIDADERTYPATDLARHRLYVAVSRATKGVTILAQGELSPLLA